MHPKQGYCLANSPDSLLLLDLELDQNLLDEGFVRDFNRHVQQARKDQGFAVEERVVLYVETDNNTKTLLKRYRCELVDQLYLEDLVFDDMGSNDSSYNLHHNSRKVQFKFSPM
jgi:isoleucyl-tRNA synthetase